LKKDPGFSAFFAGEDEYPYQHLALLQIGQKTPEIRGIFQQKRPF